MPESKPLSADTLFALGRHIARRGQAADLGSSNTLLQMHLSGGSNSRVNQVANSASAYAQRESSIVAQVYAFNTTEGADSAMSFVDGCLDVLADTGAELGG